MGIDPLTLTVVGALAVLGLLTGLSVLAWNRMRSEAVKAKAPVKQSRRNR